MRITPLVSLLLALGAVAIHEPALAQGRVYVPPSGSAERKAIMDTVRGLVEPKLHRAVIFQVQSPNNFHAQNGWAFLQAQLRQPNGAPMGKDFYARQGDFGDEVMALLHRVHGRWHIVAYALCPTDVAWEGWDKQYHAPSGIFPKLHGI